MIGDFGGIVSFREEILSNSLVLQRGDLCVLELSYADLIERVVDLNGGVKKMTTAG